MGARALCQRKEAGHALSHSFLGPKVQWCDRDSDKEQHKDRGFCVAGVHEMSLHVWKEGCLPFLISGREVHLQWGIEARLLNHSWVSEQLLPSQAHHLRN